MCEEYDGINIAEEETMAEFYEYLMIRVCLTHAFFNEGHKLMIKADRQIDIIFGT